MPGVDLGMDTCLSLHSWPGPGTPENELDCNDDWPYAPGDACADVDEGLARDSAVSTYVKAGEAVLIRVTGYAESDATEFVLNVDFAGTTECPPCGTDEGEPNCYDNYVDTYNGGCNSTPFVFQPITCHETICGTSGTFYFNGASYRDTDWFEIELSGVTDVTWTVWAEFEVLIFVIDGGTGNCVDYSILGSAVGPPYQETSLSYTVEPGRYWFWVGPTVFGSGVPCGSKYVATLLVDPCLGDVDCDGDTDLADLAALLAAYGCCVGERCYDRAADFDCDGCIDLADLAFLLSSYGC